MTVTARLERLLDSPTLPRDLASLLSSWRVGTWFCMLNAVLGLTLGIAIYLAAIANEPGIAEVSQRLGLGQYSACLLMLGIAGLCTLLIPVRATGLFEGPRWARYFDQVVLSGISPARYFAGKIVAQNIFFGLVVFAALPYAVFSLSLGGTRPSYILLGLLSLWLYANLLTIITLCVAVQAQEIGSMLGVVGLFGFLFIIGTIPFPPISGLLTPVHYLTGPIYDASFQQGGPNWEINRMSLSLGIAKLTIGSFGFFMLGGGVACALGLLYLMVGPVQCLVKANSTFGEVVMPGDTKRKSIFRLRFNLRRRSEISFFYENRPEWVIRREIPIRYGTALAGVAAAALIPFWLLHRFTPTEMNPEDFYVGNMVIFCCAMVVGVCVFACDRTIETTVLRWGKRRMTAGALDALAFAAFVGFLVLIAAAIPALRNRFQGDKWFRYSDPGRMVQGLRVQALLPFFALMGLELYGLVRFLGCKLWERSKAFTASLLMLGALWTIPFIMGLVIVDQTVFTPVRPVASAVSVLSPIPFVVFAVDASAGSEMRELQNTHWHLAAPFLHFLLTALIIRVAYREHFRLKRSFLPPEKAT